MSNGACTHDYLGLKGLIMVDGDGGKSRSAVCENHNNVVVATDIVDTHE